MKHTRTIFMLFAGLLLLCTLLCPTQAQAAEVTLSGTCGPNLTWTLDDAGTLTISGAGNMVRSTSWWPWESALQSIRAIVIEEGVTSLGSNAFSACENLTSITIPPSLQSIGNRAFSGCKKLSSVYLTDLAAWCNISFPEPESLINYNANPFSQGAKLYLNGNQVTDLVIPEGVTHIPDYAFYGCGGLNSITIPGSVERIGNYAFQHVSLNQIILCEGVTAIGEEAFYHAYGLQDIIIPSTLTSIGKNAFNLRSLKSVHITDLAAWCQIEFPRPPSSQDNPTYGYTGNLLAQGATLYVNGEAVTDLVLPEGLQHIGSYAFYGYEKITSVTIPSSVTSIGKSPFGCCTNLSAVHISDLAAWCQVEIAVTGNPTAYTEKLYLQGELLTELVIPDGVTRIGSYTFANLVDLTSVVIPDSVTSIGKGAFSGCRNLDGVTLPDSVTSIENQAFSLCQRLTSITIPKGVTAIKSMTFDCCSALTEINLPDSITSIERYAFLHCSSLKSIVLPDSVTDIGYEAFRDCTSLTDVTLPASLATIGDSAFYNCSSMVNLTLPQNVTSIGHSAFYNCNNLTGVIVPKSTRLIGAHAFAECDNLLYVTIFGQSCFLREFVFQNSSNLRYIYFPDHLVETGTGIFDGCTNLQHVLYGGTENQWKLVRFGDGNEVLNQVAKHFECTGDEIALTQACAQDLYTCSLCQAEFHTPGTKAHTWDAGTVVEAATCVREGTMAHTCTACSATKTEPIIKSSVHTWNSGIVTDAPDCINEGTTTYICTICGKTKTEPIPKATTHTYKNGQCSICGQEGPAWVNGWLWPIGLGVTAVAVIGIIFYRKKKKA